MKIQFVIPKSNTGWAYPLIKWKRAFKKRGLKIDVLSQPEFNPSKKGEVVILTSRYYRSFYATNGEYFSNSFNRIREETSELKDGKTKVVFYDLSGSTGSRELELINTFDLFLKRQLFKDKSLYCADHPYRIWVDNKQNFPGCETEQLDKLQLGWNLGYQDYTNWWVVNPKKFNLNLFKTPTYFSPESKRSLTASYRGKMGGQIQKHRQAVKDTLLELSEANPESFLTGGIVKKSKFLAEMRNSKAAVSPFGYGEICYRDMEAFISGSILVKPSMAHVNTFPDFFQDNLTYIPVKWDLSDLKKTLLHIDANYEDYVPIARAGQDLFRDVYDDFDYFYEHFVSLLNRLDR